MAGGTGITGYNEQRVANLMDTIGNLQHQIKVLNDRHNADVEKMRSMILNPIGSSSKHDTDECEAT